MPRKYAVVKDGVVENIIEAKPGFSYNDSRELVEVTGNARPHIGKGYTNGKFEQSVDTTPISTHKERKKAEVDKEAQRRIGLILPLWKQISLMSDVVAVLTKENKSYNDTENRVPGSIRYEPTIEEKARIAEAENNKASIDFITQKALELETTIDSMNIEQLNSLNVSEQNNWS